MSALLVAFDPLPRETAMSHMSRLASANGIDAATLGREAGVMARWSDLH